MTTLAATIGKDSACLLSESQLSDDSQHLKMPTECQKVFNIGSWVIAGSGWNRPGDILIYQMKWPIVPAKYQNPKEDLTGWIIKNLVPKVAQALIQQKAIDLDKGTAIQDAEFLIATHGRVWLLDEGFGITPVKDFFVSGSGGRIALGAISALKNQETDWDKNHSRIAKLSIESAIEFDIYSSGAIRGFISYSSGRVEPA